MNIIIKSMIIAAIIFAVLYVISVIYYGACYTILYKNLSEEDYKKFLKLPVEEQTRLIQEAFGRKRAL